MRKLLPLLLLLFALPAKAQTYGQAFFYSGGSAGGSGTVTSLTATAPVVITPSPTTTTGVISCATCVKSAASLTSNAVVIGGGLQASSTISADTTTTHALFATAGAPAFRALASGDLPAIAIPATVSSATSGGIPCFDSTIDMNTSAAIGAGVLIKGGGAGACAAASSVTDNGTTVATAEPINTTNVAAYEINGVSVLKLPTSSFDQTSIALGVSAANGSTVTTNAQITAIGRSTCASETSGVGNGCTAVGYLALNTTAANGDTAVGQSACTAATGANVTCIGASTASASAADTNETEVGQGVTGAGSNTATIGNASVTDAYFGSSTPAALVHAKGWRTTTNCAANGTAANPSVASCTAAAAGMFSCATNASTGTCTVNTTAVTANSEITITQNAADGGASQLNVTCNTGNVLSATAPILAAKVAATSFTINLGTVTTNPACFEYIIVN